MNLPDLCAQHPWATMFVGALAFMFVRVLFSPLDPDLDDFGAYSGIASWHDPGTRKTLLKTMPPGRRHRFVEDLERSSEFRTDPWFWKSIEELEKLAAEADRVSVPEGKDDGPPTSPDEGDDFPSGAAGADGPDACLLFPKADTRSWSPTSASTSGPA